MENNGNNLKGKKKKSCKIIKRKKRRENGKVMKIDTIL